MTDVDIDSRGIYNDLIRKFRDEGHQIYVVCPIERRFGKDTFLNEAKGVKTLHVKTLNVQKTNVIEKGLGQFSIERLFIKAVKKYFSYVTFDLILYSTPPIFFSNVVEYVKHKNPRIVSYLLLKDIFPQNAVDVGMISKNGILYRIFRNKEKKLYQQSDFIGCMSPANVHYVIEHNPQLDANKIELAPNSIELLDFSTSVDTSILKKYGLPVGRPIFIYGGNLGIPQGIPFLIKCLEANAERDDCHFLIVGSGTHYRLLEEWYKNRAPKSVTVMNGLGKNEYDSLVQSCDIGLIFLDYRFTIPNFPSRILSYMEYKMPVLCATDPVSDCGTIAEKNGFGYCIPSNSIEAFTNAVNKMMNSDRIAMGERGYKYLKDNYLVEQTYIQIIKHLSSSCE